MQLSTLFDRKSSGEKAFIGFSLFMASCVLIVAIWAKQEAARVDAAPHLTADNLTRAYQQNTESARKQFDHKLLVITGYVAGIDEGLIGGGIDMAGDSGEIQCDVGQSIGPFVVGGDYGDCAVGQSCTLAGTCDGVDITGIIRFSNCRVTNSGGKSTNHVMHR